MGSGDPMFGRNIRLAALATAAAGVLALAGCSAGDPVASAPPPSDHQKSSSPPELMGAPPPSTAPAQDGLLGGPVIFLNQLEVTDLVNCQGLLDCSWQ